MYENQFGDSEKYKSLVVLTEQVFLLDKNKKGYISTFISEFNECIKRFSTIDDIDFRKYLLDLLKKDYCEKIKGMSGKYNALIISHLSNYIFTRIKFTKQ